ncbi:hypothetical protein CNMCM8980_000863 [Aspergillus fumigatiaffinis]|nr:hypothetical protein CNMCM8980_000863 [Aspergillus fumigatiaffinis]
MPIYHRILSLIYNDFEALDFFGPLGAIVPGSDYYTLELVNLQNLRLATTYVAPEDRRAHPEAQKASPQGEETPIPGVSKEKALRHANSVAFRLEYRGHSDPADDPFVDLPGTDGNV